MKEEYPKDDEPFFYALEILEEKEFEDLPGQLQDEFGLYAETPRFQQVWLREGVRRVGKIYRGRRVNPEDETLSDVLISVNGKPLKHIVRHSPTGMQWGYGGSGPADLALSILTDVFGGRVELGDLYYQEFKMDFVAGWGDSWVISQEEIDLWLVEKTGNRIEALISKFDALDEEQRLDVKYSRRMP
jgi:hypothetical protein